MTRIYRHSQRLRVEPLEDRMLLATCNVTRLGDFGAGGTIGDFSRGDLRFCINHANNNPGPDIINFRVTGTITAHKLPVITSDIIINGPGADLLAVDGGGVLTGDHPLLNIDSAATVVISGLTISNHYVDESVAAIGNNGTLSLRDCTISNNTQLSNDFGGAIHNRGLMTISGSTISGNKLTFGSFNGKGGAIYNFGVMNILNSTISGNRAEDNADGGGIYNAGSLDIRYSTITQNYSDDDGGGIYAAGAPEKLKLSNTIVAGNTANGSGDDIQGAYTGSSNLIGGDPMLGPLADNGGPTLTHALLPGSPAIDAGDNTNAPTWDQRGPGFPRIVNGTADIGAFEVQSSPMPSSGGVGRPAPSAKAFEAQATGAPSIFENAHAAILECLILILSTIDFES
jgi:hypothetical protein